MKKASKAADNDKANLGRKEYESELRNLQVELCRLQAWVKQEGKR